MVSHGFTLPTSKHEMLAAPILRSSRDTTNALQTQISSIQQIVDVLISNSLEASASEISVHLDLTPSSLIVTCVDNGVGIPSDNLAKVGTRHYTSKATTSTSHTNLLPCHRGESLAAVCEHSVVEIITRTQDNFTTQSAVLRGGKLVKIGLAPEQRLTQGTVVNVRDIFFNRPVQRNIIIQPTKLQKEVDKCKQLIERLALVRPDTTFILFDVANKRFLLKLLRGRNQMNDVSTFFGHPPEGSITIVPDSRELDCSISGWTVLPPPLGMGFPSPNRQLVYVNKQILSTCPASVSSLITQIYNDTYTRAMNLYRSVYTQGELQVLHKGKHKCPMFVLHIRCSLDSVQFISGVEGGVEAIFRDEETILSAVQESVMKAWRPALGNGLLQALEAGRAAQQQQRSNNNLNGGRKQSGLFHRHSAPGRLLWGDIIDNSTIKTTAAGEEPVDEALARCLGGIASPDNNNGVPVIKPPLAKKLKVKDTRREAMSSRSVRSSALVRNTSDNGVRIAGSIPFVEYSTMPSTVYEDKQHAQQASRKEEDEILQPITATASRTKAMDWESRKRWLASAAQSSQQWTQTKPTTSSIMQRKTDPIFSSWTNPAMMPSSIDTGILTLAQLSDRTFIRLCPSSLTRQQLSTAQSFSQVDTKFIPIVCDSIASNSTKGGIVAIFDQHAADERVRLEQLRASLIGSDGRPIITDGSNNVNLRVFALPSPQVLELGVNEVGLLDAFWEIASAWGWRWVLCTRLQGEQQCMTMTTKSGGSHREDVSQKPLMLQVTHVPLICGTALTATDLRLYLHKLEETAGAAGLPQGVVRVLNSRACRSAIMFGDELLPAQCGQLLERLKETQLCFICAHGRPTTAPLVDLAALDKALYILDASSVGKMGRMDRQVQSLGGLKAKLIKELDRCT